MSKFTDIAVEKHGHVGSIEIQRPPLNFFDISLINQIADALEEFDRDIEIRASVLAAQGKAFCAGANFNDPARQEQEARAAKGDPADSLGQINHLYIQAVRIFRNKKPIVAAVHGAAIGGGLGLAVSADFRVTCPEARFAANFTKLGFHPGFGLTATLPELVGKNNAELIFYTSRRVTGEEATRMGLANLCVPQDQVRAEAMKLAAEIAECSPLALAASRTLAISATLNVSPHIRSLVPLTKRMLALGSFSSGSPPLPLLTAMPVILPQCSANPSGSGLCISTPVSACVTSLRIDFCQ